MNLKFRSNEFVTVITLVISWGGSIGGSQDVEESVRVNRPILRTDNGPQPWVKFSSDYVRCFCNLPSCVHTGYMCKSNGAGCFSDLWEVSGIPTGYRGRHGCLELINTKEKQCTNDWETMRMPSKGSSSKQYIHCCYQDMCNHMDSPPTKFLINSTFHGTTVRRENLKNHKPIGYSNSEVWFRAATIAVPICGAVILFVLIALAIRILRNERHNSLNYKLGPSVYIPHVPTREKYCYHHYDYLKKPIPRAHNPIYRPTTVEIIHLQRQVEAPLLVQNEISVPQNSFKNDTNAKLNQLNCEYLNMEGKSIMLDIKKECTKEPQNNIYKNINEEEKYSDVKYGDKNYAKSQSNVPSIL